MSPTAAVAGVTYVWDGTKFVAPGRTPLSPPSTGGGGGGSGMPAYPPMPAGWTKVGQAQLDASSPAGWSFLTGTENQSAANMRGLDQMQFGVGPSNDAVKITVAKVGSLYYSGELQGRQAPMEDSHVVEWYQKMGPLGSGSFPAVWARPSGPGDGELDYYEWRGRFVTVAPSNSRMTLNVITTLNGSYTNDKQTPRSFWDSLAANNIDETQWCHMRAIKTTTSLAFFINGVNVATILRNESRTTSTITTAEWDRCFAAGNKWYLRISQQWGNGASSSAAGAPDDTKLPSDLWVRDIQIWKLA
jgi:hypothetical protein